MAFSCLLRRASASALPLLIRRKPYASSVIVAVSRYADAYPTGLLFYPSYSTSAAVSKSEDMDSDADLIRIIKCEIESAKEDIDDSLKIPDAFPFKIEDNPGEKTVSLKRKYQHEVIEVLADIPDHVVNEDDDVKTGNEGDQGQYFSIPLVVSISKEKGLCLEFGITAYPDEISIDYMSTKNPNVPEDQLPYEGPDFTDLDENLQKAFLKYLDIRGITPSVTNFLIEYMAAKDAKEYLRWLKTLEKFHHIGFGVPSHTPPALTSQKVGEDKESTATFNLFVRASAPVQSPIDGSHKILLLKKNAPVAIV